MAEADQGRMTPRAVPEVRPGLKVHIASLVSPDSPKRSGSTATDTQKNQKELNRADAELGDLRMQQNQDSVYGLTNKSYIASEKRMDRPFTDCTSEDPRKN